jgi:hypothetical protein
MKEFIYLGTTLMKKIPFMKKLRADLSQIMLTTTWCRILCVPLSYPKI